MITTRPISTVMWGALLAVRDPSPDIDAIWSSGPPCLAAMLITGSTGMSLSEGLSSPSLLRGASGRRNSLPGAASDDADDDRRLRVAAIELN
ncbi:MAG TPA: hypothetical protein VIT65_16835 [Microlunatus sp.]